FALAVVLPKSRFSLQTTTLLVLLRRFARLAVVALVLLALTGLYSFWRQVGSPGALATPYGETLLVKLALFVPLLLLAAINALFVRAPSPVKRLAPRTRVSAPEQSGVRVRGWRVGVVAHLSLTLRLEAVLGALVVLAAATMTALPPARSVAPLTLVPYELTRHTGAVNVSLKV